MSNSAPNPFRLHCMKPDGRIEDWGVVWMTPDELNEHYVYSKRQLVWVNRITPSVFMQATLIKETENE